MKKEKGFAIILALILTTVILGIFLSLAKISLNISKINGLFIEGEQAFYLAEAGLEQAKLIIREGGNSWEPKYLSYTLPSRYNDIKKWFIDGELSSFNRETDMGSIRVVKKKNSNTLYAASRIDSGARKYLELKYSYPPLKVLSLKEF